MKRLVKISRFALPLLVAGCAAGVRFQAGTGAEEGTGLVLLMLGGALLGGAVSLMLESVALMTGLLREENASGPRRRVEQEQEMQAVLRSTRDVELDLALQKLEPDQAAKLTEQLEGRAAEIRRKLDDAHLQARAGIEEQIERAVMERISRASKGSAQEEAR